VRAHVIVSAEVSLIVSTWRSGAAYALSTVSSTSLAVGRELVSPQAERAVAEASPARVESVASVLRICARDQCRARADDPAHACA
jgi:hypothetical protein